MSEFETQEFTETEPKSEREGLPAGYRMRADAHYVELLSSSPRTERARPRDRRVFEHLIEEIAAIESAASMLAGDPPALARRVSLDLIKAQSARAAWLLRAHAVLAGTPPEPVLRSKAVTALLAHVRDRIAAECRLVGVALHASTDSSAVVTVDDTTISLGVTGAVIALLPLLAGVDDASIRIEAVVEEDGDDDDLQAIEVSQGFVPISATMQQRFFDADWVERPGGWLAATGGAVARAVAERFGGRATLTAGPRRGCTIRLGFE